MYYGSDEFNNAIENTQGNALKTRLKFSNEEIIELVSSMRYYGSSNDADDLTIGNTAMAYVDVSAFTNKKLVGREFLLESGVKLSDGTYEYAPIGYFTVQTPSGDYDETTFTAYDRMIKFEKPYTSNLTYPTNSAAVLNEICEMCRVTVGTPIANAITITENLKGYTCREVLGYIAGIHGFFACIDRFGELNLRWYSKTPIEKSLNCMWAFEKSQEEYQVEKVQLAKDGETNFTSGEGITTLYHSNPYATQEIANGIFASLGDYSYTPAEIEMLDDIRLDPWDVVSATYYDGIVYNIPCMSIIHDFGASSTTIKAVGKTTAENEYRFNGPTTNFLNRMATDLLVANRVIATKVDAEYVQAHAITVDNLDTIEANIKNAVIEDLDAEFATIDQLNALNVEVTGKLDVADLNAEVADLGYITANEISSKYATIDELTATNLEIEEKLSAAEADLRYADVGLANIDVANVDKAKIGQLFAEVGLIDRATITEGHVTGFLDSVEVNANKITAGTLSVDRLIFRGENSIVYELNNKTGALQAVQGDTLNGEILTDRSITVDKIVANSITANELDINKVFGNEAVLNTLTTQEAFINAISTNEIVVGANSKADEAISLSQSVNTVSGNPLLVTDSAESKPIDFQIHGTSETAYTGKNILSAKELFNSTETWIADAYYLTLHLEPNTEYTCSSDVPYSTKKNDNSIYFNGTSFSANGVYLDRPMTVTTPADGKIFIGIVKNRTYTQDLANGKYYIQIEKGPTATPYEPYVGNGLEIEVESVADNTQYTLSIPTLDVFKKGNKIYKSNGLYGLFNETDNSFTPFPDNTQQLIENMTMYADGTHIVATKGVNVQVKYYRNTTTGQQLANIHKTAQNADDVIAQWCYENDTTIIDGGKIATGTITADKLTVNDLVSLNATIGGWIIDNTGLSSTIGKHFKINSGNYEGNDYIRKNMAIIAGDHNDLLESHQLMLGFDGSVISSCRPDELYSGSFLQNISEPLTWENNYYVSLLADYESKQALHSQTIINDGGVHFSFFENTGELYQTVSINGTHVTVDNKKIMEFSDDGIIVPKILSDQGQFLELYCAGKIRSSTGEFANCYADNIQTREGANLDTVASDVNKINNRIQTFSSSGTANSISVTLPDDGVYLIVFIESLSTTSRNDPSFGFFYKNGDYIFGNVQKSSNSKFATWTYSGSDINLAFSTNLYLTAKLVNLT